MVFFFALLPNIERQDLAWARTRASGLARTHLYLKVSFFSSNSLILHPNSKFHRQKSLHTWINLPRSFLFFYSIFFLDGKNGKRKRRSWVHANKIIRAPSFLLLLLLLLDVWVVQKSDDSVLLKREGETKKEGKDKVRKKKKERKKSSCSHDSDSEVDISLSLFYFIFREKNAVLQKFLQQKPHPASNIPASKRKERSSNRVPHITSSFFLSNPPSSSHIHATTTTSTTTTDRPSQPASTTQQQRERERKKKIYLCSRRRRRRPTLLLPKEAMTS